MKQYACKQCKKWTNRKEARDCIKTHILIDKAKRKKKREGSNITEWMLRREIEVSSGLNKKEKKHGSN